MARRAQVRRAGERGRIIWTFSIVLIIVLVGYACHVSNLDASIGIPNLKYIDRRGNVSPGKLGCHRTHRGH
jgi:hypothetical protein